MNETMNEDRLSVYEIGYLIAPSIPEEKVPAEADAVRHIMSDAGASIVAEEAPAMMPLAYEMRKKTVGGSYDKYDRAYFGWVKFEAAPDAVEAAKKKVEAHPSILRMLLISTVKENTYLGKRAQAVAADIGGKKPSIKTAEEKPIDADKEAAPATVEEMDKSIDALVKEA